MMKTLEYKIRFTTPAFLGNADQQAQWRTPPFKALLRQWWRVAYAADHGYRVNLADMRREEGLLFGHAWLENDAVERGGRNVKTAARRSLVRLRLSRWDTGSLKKARWPGDSSVTHPEVKNRDGRTIPVGSALYLGYGPLTYDSQRRTTTLKANAAIQAGESATLSIAFPTTHKDHELKRLAEVNASRLEHALWLIDRYGALGGRARNGWGSFSLEPSDDSSRQVLEGHSVPFRNLADCLDEDWPHALGLDKEGELIWRTAPHDGWEALMKTLAIVKIGLRTQFAFTTGRNSPRTEPRHWLSYPVTKHSVGSWGGNLRLPNQLRFKAREYDDQKLVGIIFHIPHLPPAAFRPDHATIKDAWKRVHGFLDAHAQQLTRIPE